MINLQIARAYLSAADSVALSYTWQFVMDELAKGKHGTTKIRWMGYCSVIVAAGTPAEMVQRFLNWNQQSKGFA